MGSQTTTTNRCPLCGAHTARTYCYAHSWAGYDQPEPQKRPDELARARIYRDGFRDGRRSANLPQRPAGTLGTVGSHPSPAGRIPIASVESVSASNRQPREVTA